MKHLGTKIATSLLVIFTLLIPVNAAPSQAELETAPDMPSIVSENIIVINDPELVAQAENPIVPSSIDPDPVDGRSGYVLKNRTLLGQYYYGDQPFLADKVKGPMDEGPELEISTKATAGYNIGFGLSSSLISSTFGVNFSYEYSLTRIFKFNSIPAGRTLEYRAFVNYSVYQYDIYSGGVKQGTGKYWVPVGIVIDQNLI